ncbi:MAG: CocE/NonD family hydrolase [Burkholderiales bacterium]|nr:MAG: CocE/NonD family hydrolase [Burkholderiales bacterium]
MKVRTEFPRAVRSIEHMWIPMSDGVRLSARIWLPDDAERHPVPAVLEYIPYRKRDATRSRDELMHPWIAGHGYACVRVDIRGSGDSEGVLEDEYLQRELDDGVEIIGWLASQPWCDGGVGMIGISWGGFNGLQIAAMQPPQLKAIVSVCSTDDRYADDVHHMGGCLLGDNLSWASTMFAYNSLPPDPEIVGDRWRPMWMGRLEGSGLWMEKWLRHQRRDAYWRHGSICEDYARVSCPVFAVSGWADGYSNAVFRLLAGLRGPCKGLIGPWGHRYPHIGIPGPDIGFLQECLRWWDHWLKGIDSGVMDEPRLHVWMQDSVPPTTRYHYRPGRWVAEPGWPSPHVGRLELGLAPNRLLAQALPPAPAAAGAPAQSDPFVELQSPLTVGLFAGKWCSYTAAPDLPHDQRQEDGGALVFDSEPLSETLEILGSPELELELEVDHPVAMIAARLSDMRADGKATRVTYGLLNLTHREGSEQPRPLEPGRRYRVRLSMNAIAHSFPPRHRVRLALSTSYWPLAWPSPRPVRLCLFPLPSRLFLPTRAPRPEDGQLRPFEEPESSPGLERRLIEPEHHNWRVTRDLETDESTLEVIDDSGVHDIPSIGLRVQRKVLEWYRSQADEYDSVRGETVWSRGLQRGDWRVRTLTRTVLTSDAESFRLRAELDAFEGETRVYSRNWDVRIPRDLV